MTENHGFGGWTAGTHIPRKLLGIQICSGGTLSAILISLEH
jgi:hypothetical protein